MVDMDEDEFRLMVEKGTKAWAGTPDNWVDELRGGPDDLADDDLQSDDRPARLLPKYTQTKESEIAYENGKAWVCQDKMGNKYTVFVADFLAHIHMCASDSSYEMTEDGFSVAKARADYLAKPRETT